MSDTSALTSEQTAVVKHAGPRLFVCACPGSGKTRTVVDRFLTQSSELSPRRGIAVLSFSKLATTEIRRRCSKEGLERLLCFPNYVGTLDGFFARFVFRSAMQVNFAKPVRVLESWDALSAKVKVAGIRSPGVSLDAFPLANKVPRFDPTRLRGSESGMKQEIEHNRAAWEANAAKYVSSLNAKGYYDCESIRSETRALLSADGLGRVVLLALAARFEEIIVDEAQDCDEDQLSVLTSLAGAGVRLVVVADPEQAIYEFRSARPDLLADLTKSMPRLGLTGNWRSTPAICNLANSMRSAEFDAMKAVGDRAADETPVFIIPYEGTVADAAPTAFVDAVKASGVEVEELLVLSHRRSMAMKSAGVEEFDGAGGGAGATVVRIAGAIAAGTLRGQEAEKRIGSVEQIVLRRLGIERGDRSIKDACFEENLDWRWLRGAAFSVVRHVYIGLGDRDAVSLSIAVDHVRRGLESVEPPPGRSWVRTAKSLAPLKRAHATDEVRFRRSRGQGCKTAIASTIHGVKGGESAAVLVVLPAKRDVIVALLEAWEGRTESEAKRVAYVAMTRAEQVLGIAVPRVASERLQKLLRDNGVSHRIVQGSQK